MPKPDAEKRAGQEAEVCITRVRLYSEKLSAILAVTDNQFFPSWRHYVLEEVIECGEVVLETFKLTPPMQGLALEQWLLQDEVFRYEQKYRRTKNAGFLEIITRLQARVQVIHELFLQELKKSSQSKRTFFLFDHPETSLHIENNWTCHILGYPDILKR